MSVSVKEFAKSLLDLASVAPDQESASDIRSVVHYLYLRHTVPFEERNLIIKSKIIHGFNNIPMISTETGFSPQQVRRSVEFLESKGEIETAKVRYHTKGRPAKVLRVVEKRW